MLTQLAIGPVADRAFERHGNRRGFYAAGAILAAPALLWFFLAPTYAQLIAAFFVLQLGMNILAGPYAAIVPDYVADDRAGAASSWLGMLQAVGNIAGLLVAGFIASPLADGALLAAGLVASWLVTARVTQALTPARSAMARTPLRIGPEFRTLLISRTAINFGFYTLLGFLFFFVGQSLGVAAVDVRTTTAILFLTFTLGNVIGALAGAKPADRFDKRNVVCVANAVVGLGLAGLALTSVPGIAFACAGVAGIAWGAYFIADWALACTLLPRGAMASAMAVWNVTAALPQIVAPLVTAPLVTWGNALAPGAGPRIAIVLAIVEFTAGALWLYRLSPARTGPADFGVAEETLRTAAR